MDADSHLYENYIKAYNQMLLRWPVPVLSQLVNTRFGNTHVLISGNPSSPPLILLHEYMFSSTMWYPNIEELSQKYRVYAIDIIGDTNKSALSTPLKIRRDYSDWLIEICMNFDIRRAAFMGLSYGGMIALNMAIDYPNFVSHAIILSPAASFVPLRQQPLLQAMKMKQSPTGSHEFLKWLFSANNNPIQEFSNQLAAGVEWGGFHISEPENHMWPYVFSDEELVHFKVPTLLMFGENEKLYNPEEALARAEHILPNVSGEIVPHAGHALSMECSDYVNQKVLTFIREIQ